MGATLELRGHLDGVWDLDASEWDARLLASASADSTVALWSLRVAKQVLVYEGHRGSVNSVRFHPQLPLVMTASGDRSVHMFRVPRSCISSALSASDDDDSVVPFLRRSEELSREDSVASEGMSLTALLDKASGQQGRRSRSHSEESAGEDEAKDDADDDSVAPYPDPLAYSQDKERPRSNSWPHVDSAAPTPRLGPVRVTSPDLSITGVHKAPVSAAAWIAGGDRLASGGWDRLVRVFAVEAGQARETLALSGHEKRINNVTAHDTQPFILSCSNDSTARLWDIRAPLAVYTFNEHSADVNTAVFSPHETHIMATAGDDKDVHIWDSRKCSSPLRTISCHTSINRLCFSPSGLMALPADDGSTLIYNTQAQLKSVESGVMSHGRKRMVCACAWSRDGSFMFSSGWDLTVFAVRQ